MNTHFPPSLSASNTKSTIRNIADSAPMLMWMLDADNICVYLNPGAASMFAKGETIDISAWLEFMHPDDAPRALPALRAALDGRHEYQIEYRIIRSDGSVRWMLGSGAPRHAGNGEFLGYIGSEMDVSDRHAAIDQITKSEAAHRLLTENSSDLIMRHDVDGTILHVSPSVTPILGYKPAELTGKSLYNTIHADDIALIEDEVHRQVSPLFQSSRESESRVVELRKLHKDGHYVWFATKMRVLTDPVTKECTGVISVCRDMTTERQARDELRQREERFRSLTDLSSDWYWETDEEGRFSFISDSVERIFGAPAGYILGKSRADIADDPNQSGLLRYWEKLAERQPFRNVRYSTAATGDGKLRYLSVSGEPVFGGATFKGYRGVGRDITEEIEVAARLARLAEENEALVENSLDIIALLDAEGRFLRVNEAVTAILGYAPEDWLGRQYDEFLHPDELQKTRATHLQLRTGKNTVEDFETRWLRKDGSAAYLSLSVRWAADKNAMYATARDVTERYRAQAELQKSKDRMWSMLESIGDAFFALDQNWRVTYVNQKTCTFVNVEHDEVIGKMVWEAVPEILTSPVLQYYRTAMETRTALSFEEYWEPSQAWIEVRVYPQEDGIAVYFHDISARRAAEQTVRESEKRFRDIIEMTPAGYIFADGQSRFRDVNPALCAIAGYGREELVGHSLGKLFSYCPWHGALSVQNGPTSVNGMEAVARHKHGHDVHVLFSGTIQRDQHGHALSFTAFLTDITARKQAENRLEQLATHDTLTGLPNRALLNVRLQQMLDGAPRNQQVAVLFIDLDRFKEVNDSFGHQPGDVLLCEVGRRLQKSLRPGDFVARLGGDEFVVAAYCSSGRESASAIAKKLLSALLTPVDIAGQDVFVGASIGISMFPEDGQTKELLFQNADTAMYRAKAAGRNGYRFFEAAMSAETKTRMTLDLSMRHALERDEFVLHYQPRIDLKTMSIVGMEALIRWNHPVLGQVPPMQFIPIAEDNGLIESIGHWVLKEACVQTRRLMGRFGRPLQVSVNLSARQMKSRTIVEQVREVLRDTNLPPHLLELELTESTLIEDIEHSAGTLNELKRLGLQLSVDDFGTGYSSLAYLRRFPLDVLKLDRSFVMQYDDGNNSIAFIKAFIDMAHALKLSVVAEGVETSEALQFLRNAACDEAQGYFLARPLTLDAFETYLSRLPGVDLKTVA